MSTRKTYSWQKENRKGLKVQRTHGRGKRGEGRKKERIGKEGKQRGGAGTRRRREGERMREEGEERQRNAYLFNFTLPSSPGSHPVDKGGTLKINPLSCAVLN